MLTTIVESLLPGARSLRPPLISGIVWTLFFWILITDLIPTPEKSTGWMSQLYAAANAVGPVTVVSLCAITVFIVGASLATIAELIGSLVGRAANRVVRAVRWQRYAQGSRRRLNRELLEARKAAAVTESEQDVTTEIAGRRRRRLSAKLADLEMKVAEVDRQGLRKLLLGDTLEIRRLLGSPPAAAFEGLETELIREARTDGQSMQMQEISEYINEDELHEATWDRDSNVDLLAKSFLSELDADPLEVLQSLNQELFLSLDRMRAEREVRLAFSTPLLAVFVLAAAKGSSAWWLILSIIPLAIIARSSFAQTQERTRVLRLIRLHSLRTPAIRRAYDLGRGDVRAVMRKRRIAASENTQDTVNLQTNTDAT